MDENVDQSSESSSIKGQAQAQQQFSKKYTFLAIAAIIVGIFLAILAIGVLFFVIPPLNTLYSNVNLNVESKLNNAYFASYVLLGLGALNVVAGIQLLRSSAKVWFWTAIVFGILTFPIAGSLSRTLIFSIISPIYKLTREVGAPTLTQPSSSPIPDRTANWKTYANETFGVSVKYPPTWEVKGIAPNYITFVPPGANLPKQIEAQLPGIGFRMLHFNYNEAVRIYTDAYGTENQEVVNAGGLSGIHIWGTQRSGQAQGLSGGAYILNNHDGNAFQFEYEVINGRSYQKEAQQMMMTIQVTNF